MCTLRCHLKRKEEEALSAEFIPAAWARYLECLLVRQQGNMWMLPKPGGLFELEGAQFWDRLLRGDFEVKLSDSDKVI